MVKKKTLCFYGKYICRNFIEVIKFLRESHVLETFLYCDLIKHWFTVYWGGGIVQIKGKKKEYF